MTESPQGHSTRLTGDFSFKQAIACPTSTSLNGLEETQSLLMSWLCAGLPNTDPIRCAIEHHFGAGGKRVRMALSLDCGSKIGLSREDCVAQAIACELIHNASLVHDDLQDQDETRRGSPAVWACFGPNVAILVGDYLLSAAYSALAKCQHRVPELIQHLHHRTTHLVIGQSHDLAMMKSKTLEGALTHYRHIVAGKSGALLSLPIELALISAELDTYLEAAKVAGESFAVAYQIADDLCDLETDYQASNLNIMHLLTEHGAHDSLGVARHIAAKECQKAMEALAILPHHLGQMMSQQAQALVDGLPTGD